MIGIYKIENPKGKIYIGQSVNIYKRFLSYAGLRNCKEQVKLYNSLIKYGVDNHIFEIVCECDVDELNEKERFYQDKYDVVDNGLNLRYTKTNDRCGNMSLESVQKMKDSSKHCNLGKIWITKDNICKIIDKEEFYIYENLGFKLGQAEYHKERNRQSNIGRKHSEETRRKISIGNTNKKRSASTKLKLKEFHLGKYLAGDNPNAKSVAKLDKVTNELLNIYTTGKEAAEINKVNRSKISSCCTGKRKSAGGFKWMFYLNQ